MSSYDRLVDIMSTKLLTKCYIEVFEILEHVIDNCANILSSYPMYICESHGFPYRISPLPHSSFFYVLFFFRCFYKSLGY